MKTTTHETAELLGNISSFGQIDPDSVKAVIPPEDKANNQDDDLGDINGEDIKNEDDLHDIQNGDDQSETDAKKEEISGPQNDLISQPEKNKTKRALY
ncbi:MAG: hypothetical protein JWQ63_125 [Mucilaginibacter sp.]|jgi:hypothetical protein|nr:hypothetical protein [Mucilaginibacter sp.]